MNISITGRHMELSDGLKAAALAEADRLPRYFDRISHVEIVFDKDHNQICTEIITSTVKGKTIVGKSEDYDSYKSLKKAAHKVSRQLKKFNDQLNEIKVDVDQKTDANPANRDRPGEELPDEAL